MTHFLTLILWTLSLFLLSCCVVNRPCDSFFSVHGDPWIDILNWIESVRRGYYSQRFNFGTRQRRHNMVGASTIYMLACRQYFNQQWFPDSLRSQAWRGFASRAALDSFLMRSVKAGFYPPQSRMFEELCDALDNGLFKTLVGNPVPLSIICFRSSAENNETMGHKKPIPSISTAEPGR